ncbi:Tat pathway signal sequence domain protein [Streptomyces sp. UH6]|uniref:Tat pathway signal sequence domain protein n=1 Tax=Streptomyces sp. UH6 TaxID=2748379 RepID=UPI0015D4711D|nr:Tat pathway signal sequence domain protein [Streptomyces sp. UH6]NYV76034.1 Tat pathway signal sequence domain protein [Streptomyces sp. UH6]
MRNRRFALLAATALTGAATLGGMATATAAPTAGNVLTYGSAGGTAVAVGDNLSAAGSISLSSTSPVGSLNCSSSNFAAKVASNPTAPGTATESNVNVTVNPSSCVISLPGATGVSSISIATASATVTSAGVVTVTPLKATAVLNSLFGPVTCIYQASSLVGSSSNADNSINFSNQTLTLTNSEPTCPLTTKFSGSYKPVVKASTTTKVFVN